MRSTVRTGASLLVVAAAVALPPASASTAAVVAPPDRTPASTGGVAANSTVYIDGTADVPGGGVDITTVTVSNDNAGNMRLSIVIPSHAALPTTKELGVVFDTDRNSANGSEFAIFSEGSSGATRFFRWDPAQNLFIPAPQIPVTGTFGGGGLTISFNRSGLGTATTIDFRLFTRLEQSPFTVDDRAPNSGIWTYEIRIDIAPPTQPNRVAITSFAKNPRIPLAGEAFEVTVTVRRVGRTGQWRGIVYCTASVGGRELRLYASPGTGRASCLWNIPVNAAGKILRGSIAVNEAGGPIITRRFSGRVINVGAHLSIEGGIARSPSRPASGQPFYYRFGVAVERGGDHKRIVTGGLACRATIGGRPVPVFEEKIVRRSGIRCGWRIPSGTSGRTFTASIHIRSEGGTLTHRYTQRIT